MVYILLHLPDYQINEIKKMNKGNAMRKNILPVLSLTIILLLCHIHSAGAVETVSKSPYAGAIVVDAATGKVLFEDNADAKGYPASVTKLMVLLVILEAIESQHLTLDDPITITADASKIGGSQVFLKENEVFTVDELLYALIVQSANDAATALAIHYAGTKEAFVDLMNKRAQELGMKDTVFHSVHGLPPSKDQLPDVSTPRDIAKLCQELLKRPDSLKYTSTKERPFRPDAAEPFMMRSHNHLLGNLEGCDGFKTGYFSAAGFSIAATAQKKGQRAVAVVMGSVDRKVRDAKTKEILSKGLMGLVGNAPPVAPVPAIAQAPVKDIAKTAPEVAAQPEPPKSDFLQIKKSTLKIIGATIGCLVILGFVLFVLKKNRKPRNTYMG
jgi:serine-type D-Ala-D-Ala carboxypeptidase (penicillin-binding protein 5/6)